MKSLLLAASVSALIATAAAAQAPPTPPNPDLDHDGRVTFSEFKKMDAERQTRMFARIDTNKDGKISQAEMAAGRQARNPGGAGAGAGAGAGPGPGLRPGGAAGQPGARMQRMDANGDGFITKAEMSKAAEARFQAADTNHDGWLSKGEVIMLRQRGPGGGGQGPAN